MDAEKTNIYALLLCILKNWIPEQAYAYLNDELKYKNSVLTDEDTSDMIKLKNQELSLKDIGYMYNLSASGVFRRIERYEGRKE